MLPPAPGGGLVGARTCVQSGAGGGRRRWAERRVRTFRQFAIRVRRATGVAAAAPRAARSRDALSWHPSRPALLYALRVHASPALSAAVRAAASAAALAWCATLQATERIATRALVAFAAGTRSCLGHAASAVRTLQRCGVRCARASAGSSHACREGLPPSARRVVLSLGILTSPLRTCRTCNVVGHPSARVRSPQRPTSCAIKDTLCAPQRTTAAPPRRREPWARTTLSRLSCACGRDLWWGITRCLQPMLPLVQIRASLQFIAPSSSRCCPVP